MSSVDEELFVYASCLRVTMLPPKLDAEHNHGTEFLNLRESLPVAWYPRAFPSTDIKLYNRTGVSHKLDPSPYSYRLGEGGGEGCTHLLPVLVV